MSNSVFDKYYRELSEVSRDSDNGHSLIESSDKVIDFDCFKNDFFKGKTNLSAEQFCSCDMLSILNDDEYVFVEFKNTLVDKKVKYNVYEKFLHSLFLLEYILKKHAFDMNLSFILVCSEEKNKGKHASQPFVDEMDKLTVSKSNIHMERLPKSLIKNCKVIYETEFEIDKYGMQYNK